MKKLQITLFMIGLLILSTQTFRHVYVKWFMPRTSVMDQFWNETEREVAKAATLDELIEQYKEAKNKVDEQKEMDKANGEGEYTEAMMHAEQNLSVIQSAIHQVENHRFMLHRLHFFWGSGVASLLIGLLCYLRVNRWLGMVGILAGFTEMIFWTSPTFAVFGAQREFNQLLTEKLIFSAITWVMLIGLWLVVDRRRGDIAKA